MNLPGLFPRLSAILAVVFVCALVSGCSDDGDGPGDSGTADTGGSIDKGPSLDGDPTPDSAPPVCDNTCRQQDVQLCVKDGTGTCVQCLEDKHCKGNPDADGMACDTATNKCFECKNNNNAFCVGHPSGPVCDETTCTCAQDADCTTGATSGTKCITFPALKRCGCEADPDCQGSPLGSICRASFNKKCTCKVNGDCKDSNRTACQLPYYYADYGQCDLPCKSDADCGKEQMTRCKVGVGTCVECTSDGDCQGVDRGAKCMPDSTCGCATKADCLPNEICDVDLGGKTVCFTS